MINLVDDSSNESLLTVESSINAAQNRQVMRRGSMVVTGSDAKVNKEKGSPFEPMKAEYSHSLKEPLRLAAEAAARNSRSQLGAINESLTVQQQLPLKLAGSRGGKQSPTHVFRPMPTTGVQFIPAYDQQQQQQQQCVDSRLAGPSHVFRPTPSHTISTPSSASQHLPYRLAEGGAARAAQQLPLKLASDSTKPRPRSANSSQSGGHSKPHMSSPPDSAKHSLFAKDRQEPEIIYF
ncbi:hypothetical protein CAPTEDRAFT_205799 [Capitella teleta]|uniref:Uncharacterized protein n=1 Tax=Capitella teleta TaxID=283909 RepID=R7T7P9_CAPTE|nr:hypothetical protein CAPTEDRAFT_205799 [Capitella teleta]|eukprot:ELT89635.1 hypothetical protein CAPTEDRAFT_205799 [Capitella teleta]